MGPKSVQVLFIIIIVIIFLHGLGRLTFSGIDAFPSFPGAFTISSSSGFVVEGVFGETVVMNIDIFEIIRIQVELWGSQSGAAEA